LLSTCHCSRRRICLWERAHNISHHGSETTSLVDFVHAEALKAQPTVQHPSFYYPSRTALIQERRLTRHLFSKKEWGELSVLPRRDSSEGRTLGVRRWQPCGPSFSPPSAPVLARSDPKANSWVRSITLVSASVRFWCSRTLQSCRAPPIDGDETLAFLTSLFSMYDTRTPDQGGIRCDFRSINSFHSFIYMSAILFEFGRITLATGTVPKHIGLEQQPRHHPLDGDLRTCTQQS
jgi:hypothetical protein